MYPLNTEPILLGTGIQASPLELAMLKTTTVINTITKVAFTVLEQVH